MKKSFEILSRASLEIKESKKINFVLKISMFYFLSFFEAISSKSIFKSCDVDITRILLKLPFVSLERSFVLFKFMTENTCSQRYVVPNIDKIRAEKLIKF